MPIHPPSVVRVNADSSGGGHAVAGTVLGGTAGDGWGRAAAYDAYADGLHTYALWYLRDHDAAADAVYCAFVAADRNHTNLQQPEQIQPWLYALLRRECRLRSSEAADAPTPVSLRLRPKSDALGESGVGASLIQLEGNLRRAEFQSLAWPEAEGLVPAHREVLELSIRHGLDSRGLALVLGLRDGVGVAGLVATRGFGLLADAWRELERSLAAAAVAGSGRDNCAQLAELTFGWSGKLNATLRAPLAEHVDRCSRCQHYLHTVIGTPSAPTILPFVAAPRALRDLLLGELSNADAAADAGVDLLALAARCGTFGPEGFPARVDPSSQGSGTAAAGAGRGPRRRQPGAGRPNRPQRTPSPSGTTARPQPVHKGPGGGSGGGSTVGFTATAAGTAILSGSGGSSTVGFTATAAGTAVLPPASDMRRRPSPTQATNSRVTNSQVTNSQAASNQPDSRSTNVVVQGVPVAQSAPPTRPRPRTSESDELFRARGSWADKVLPPASAPEWPAESPGSIAGFVDNDPAALWRPAPDQAFVQTPSGRFATRPPAASPPAASTPATPKPVRPASGTKPTGPSKPGGSSAPPAAKPRHKARPMRQAVVSAMALGAIGAVAAAAAAMLGATSNPHSNTTALDGSQSAETLGSASTSPSAGAGPSNLTVSVTTGSTGSATGLLTGASGLGVGLLPTTNAGDGSSAAASPTTTGSAGAFYVSVNQRAADPDSVQILLRNTGSGPLSWSAAPSESWLTLSRSSGTLAAGQSMTVTATATSAGPSGEWTARIVFSPGGIVVTLHGGVPAGSSGTPTTPASGGGGGTTASSSPTSASPTTSPSSPPPTQTSPTATATSGQPSASSSDTTSGSQGPTPTDTASNPPSTPPSQ